MIPGCRPKVPGAKKKNRKKRARARWGRNKRDRWGNDKGKMPTISSLPPEEARVAAIARQLEWQSEGRTLIPPSNLNDPEVVSQILEVLGE